MKNSLRNSYEVRYMSNVYGNLTGDYYDTYQEAHKRYVELLRMNRDDIRKEIGLNEDIELNYISLRDNKENHICKEFSVA